MDYIRITDDNIEKEHICCAMSGKQGVIKKEWLKQRFKEGLVFCRSTERGKCFIEYIPAENAWVPIQADGYFYIDCLWVSGSLKGHGYSNDLLEECIRDAKERGRKGLCILSSGGRKREFLSDPKYLAYKGFAVADTSECGINLMYLPLAQDAEPPRFKGLCQAPCGGRERLCPLLYRPVPVYLLLGAACGRSRESVQCSFEGHSYHQQGAGTERTRPGDDLRAVQGRQVPDPEHSNGQKISEACGNTGGAVLGYKIKAR